MKKLCKPQKATKKNIVIAYSLGNECGANHIC